jgi:hypothetical protein
MTDETASASADDLIQARQVFHNMALALSHRKMHIYRRFYAEQDSCEKDAMCHIISSSHRVVFQVLIRVQKQEFPLIRYQSCTSLWEKV